MFRLLPIFFIALLAVSGSAFGQIRMDYGVVHDFGGTVTNANGLTGPDGQNPFDGVTFDNAGNMFGTADNGGFFTQGFGGVLWEITVSGTYIDLHDFGGPVTNADGTTGPDGVCAVGVAIDGAGNLYGTAYHGGAYGGGMVWELTASGIYLDLHDFGGTVTLSNGSIGQDSIRPYASVTLDKAGNVYGTTASGGPNLYGCGMLWEITNSGNYIDLHDFGGALIVGGTIAPDGQHPEAGVSIDIVGNLYGTASQGGVNDGGMVWEMTTSGAFFDLHDFEGTVVTANGRSVADGWTPYGGVTFDGAGDMFGTTVYGGASGAGIVWEITASGTYLDLHDFGQTVTNADGSSGLDGVEPWTGVTVDGDGNLYGTTQYGGGNRGGYYNGGMVWEITASGAYFDLHDFNGTTIGSNGSTEPDGDNPYASVTLDKSGNLYGVAYYGGPQNAGLLWTLSAATIKALAISPGPIVGGNPALGTLTLSRPAPFGGLRVWLASNNSNGTVPASVTVSGGALVATFPVATTEVKSSISAVISAGDAYGSVSSALTINPPSLASLSLSPSTVSGGTASTCTLTLNGLAGPGGLTVNLSCSSSWAKVPPTVTVAAGQSSANFTVNTQVVSRVEAATINAQSGAETASAVLTITRPIPTSVVLNPSSVAGGVSTSGTVTLSGPAPPGGQTVSLRSNSDSATTPSVVMVAAGRTSAVFAVRTTGAAIQRTATIVASVGDAAAHATLTINPISVAGFTLSPTKVTAGGSSTGTVTLTYAAPPGGMTVQLSSSSSSATAPSMVTVAHGRSSASFTVKTVAVSTQTAVIVTASLNGSSQSATLTINPRKQ